MMPGSIYAPASGQAVLAGVSGPADDPEIHWSIILDKVGASLDEWSLFYRAPDGARTQIGPAWWWYHWATVEVVVDEDADTVLLRLDGGPAQAFTGVDLGASERVAVGDVFHDLLEPWGRGTVTYDEVAVYPAPS